MAVAQQPLSFIWTENIHSPVDTVPRWGRDLVPHYPLSYPEPTHKEASPAFCLPLLIYKILSTVQTQRIFGFDITLDITRTTSLQLVCVVRISQDDYIIKSA